MESMLRETLKSLCHKNGWSYAVFWKIKSGNRKILTWEEGYYEPANPPDVSNLSTHLVPDSLLSGWDTGRNPLDRGVCSQNGCSVEDQIGLAVAQMSHQAHSLGEGIIGRVALTGKHRWVFREENCSSEGDSIGLQNSPSNFEFPAGWQNQFAAGIKTIAIIAVASYGVVQLGSTQTIMENLELVCNIKTLFSKPQHVPGAFLSGCIQENSFSSLPLFSHGNQSMTGTRNATLFHSLSNRPMPKNTSSGVLEQGYSSLYPLGVTKGLQSQARSLPSMCSSTGSSKPSSHFSQFQQNRMQLKCPTPTVTSVPRTEMGENRTPSGARVMYPFQGMTHTNTCTGDNHQALLIGSDTGSNQLALMEQQLVKEMGLRGQLHMFPSSSGQSTVQPKFQTNMFTGFQDVSALNSIFSRVESNNTGIALQSNLNASNKEEGVLRTALLEAGGCHPSALKQPDMQPSVPTFQDVAGHSENFVASSRSVVRTNPVAGMNSNHASLDEVDISNTAYKFPAFSSVNIQACGTDAKEPSCDSWGISAEQLDARLLKTLGNDLMPSLGNDLSVSEAVGVEQQSWDKEIITKDMSALFQDNTVDTLYPIKESSKASETGFGELLAITDDCSPHGFDGFDKYLKSLTKGQDNSSNAISALPTTNELFDTLVPAFRSSQDQVIWDEILLPRGDGNNARGGTHSFELSTGSAVVSELDGTQSFDVSAHMGLEGTFFPECKSEHLLDAVVANIRRTVNKSADDTLSSKTTFSRLSGTPSLYSPSVRADSCSTGPLSGCDQKQSEFVGLSQCLENADLRNLQNPAFTSEFQGERAAKKSSPNESPLKRHPSSWGEDGQSAKCENLAFAQVKKSDEPVKVNRKRARPGESARPRPKDRQQIQDRVKELREIVPNGTKCSIDALLERTIKHMLFLQSVTKHADKLKQSGESKVLDKDGSLIARDNVEGGASWALELGDQTMGCPIVVENLNQPRQMLVEMLCEERGLFLEIADIIRGLGLTILKGVMEARKDKIWAHFAVEANRDVHRVEILWSLMRLLQQNNKNSSSPTSQPSLVTPQGMDNGSQTFNVFQQPLIPTFGMAERLQ